MSSPTPDERATKMAKEIIDTRRRDLNWVKRIHSPAENEAAAAFMLRGVPEAEWQAWPLGLLEMVVGIKLIQDDLEREGLKVYGGGGGPEEQDHVRTLLVWKRNLDRIADAHQKQVDEHGGTWGGCNECGLQWPCPTYVWATDDSRNAAIDCWDPADDE